MNTKQLPRTANESLIRLRQCLPVEQQDFPCNQPLVELGFDSLDTVEFLCTVDAEFDVRLLEEDLFPGQTLEGLNEVILQRMEQS